MPEQGLYGFYVFAVLYQQGRKSVTEGVPGDVLSDPSPLGCWPCDLHHAVGPQRLLALHAR